MTSKTPTLQKFDRWSGSSWLAPLNADLVNYSQLAQPLQILSPKNSSSGSLANQAVAAVSLPVVTITATDSLAGETLASASADDGLFTISRTGDTTTALTINYTLGGSATRGTDYNNVTGTTSNSGSIVIPVGQSNITIPITVTDDLNFEGTENIVLTLASNSAYTLGTTKTATIAIADNDLPTITITASDASAGETATGVTANPGAFRITRTGSTAAALTVNYTLSGTATNGTDYGALASTSSITIPVGTSSVTIPINVIDDTDIEGAENVILTLGSNSAYTLGTTTTATVNIAENDKPTVTIVATDANAGETATGVAVNNGLFTISRTGSTAAALTINYTLSGTATRGTDYNNVTGTTSNSGSIVIPVGQSSVTVPIAVTDDLNFEGTENIVFTLASNSAYILESNSATIAIADNDLPTLTITASDASAGETATGVTANPGAFRINRTGSTAAALTVNYTLSGTATNGTDYGALASTSSITIPVGASSITIPINAIDDADFEGTENIILTLGSNSAYALGTTTTATVNIADNDKPTVTIIASDADAGESNGNSGMFTITRTGSTSAALTVSYSVSGTATKGTDYNNITNNANSTGTVVIPIGASSITVPINVTDDTLFEGTENVILSLTSASAYNLGNTTSATVTIADNDLPTVSITATDAIAGEITSSQTPNSGLFTITRTGNTSSALTINYTIGGSATQGSDYTSIANAGTIVFAEGVSSVTLPIDVIDDSLQESSETVVITLGTGAGYTLGNNIATVTISDNDSITNPTLMTRPLSGNNDIDSLLGDYYYWNTSNNNGVITYSFYSNTSGTYYGSEVVSEVTNTIKNNVRNILASLSTFINVNFVEVADTASSYGVMRYMLSNGPSYAYAYYPGSTVGGDVHLSTNSVSSFEGGIGTYGYTALIHETLHALGIKHPGNYNGTSGTGEGPFLAGSADNNTNTVMSYNNGGYGAGRNNATAMAYDIRALQYIYGARNYNNTNSTYVFSNVYNYTIGGQTFGSTTTQLKQSIWDSGGIDTFDFSNLSSTNSYRFDLNQGGLITAQSAYNASTYNSWTGGVSYTTTTYGTAIAYNSVIENLINSRGNDYIIANSAANTFSGYTLGVTTGNDIYNSTNSSDTIELSSYALSDLTASISGTNLTVSLGSFGSIQINNYFGTGNDSRFSIGGNYYRYSLTGGWQIATSPSVAPTPTNDHQTFVSGSTQNTSSTSISTATPQRCQCVICSATSIATGRLGASTLMEAINM